MTIPYAGATTGAKARDEVVKMLRRFGCESVGFMDDFEAGELLLAFKWRGRQVQLRASAKGWASAYLKENPYSYRMRRTNQEYERWAYDQGMIAVNSILRDWVKGQVTAIETGMLSFEHVFMPYMLLPNGSSIVEHIKKQGLLEHSSDVKS